MRLALCKTSCTSKVMHLQCKCITGASMPTVKPRITITLEPHSHEVLSRLSAASRQSMASIVTEILDTAIPSLERVVVVLERAANASQEVRDGVAAAVERAERELMPTLLAAAGQSDLFLADLAHKASGDVAAQDAQASGKRRRPASKRKTPVL